MAHSPLKTLTENEKATLIQEVWCAFRDYFKNEMNSDLKRKRNPADTGRIDFEIVTNGLEYTKDLLAGSYGVEAEHLFARAKPMAETTWATQAPTVYGWEMREYLLDFSISFGAIDVVIGAAHEPKLPEDRRFELVLGAESEMGTENDVCWDLLKLLDTRCLIKVLFYQARIKQSAINSLKDRIEVVLNGHASDPMQDVWLVAGLPTYSHWHEYRDNRHDTPRQVYTLERRGDNIRLNEVPEWWELE